MADLSPGLGMISTRTSRSSMSSNVNPLPLMRRTSESSAPSTPSTPSSIPSFRAIRNLLPFGNSKPASPAQPPTQTKHPFHFSSLRRSSDRKPSISSVRDRQHDQGDPPVISISRLDDEEFGAHKRSYDIVRAASASDSLLPSLSIATTMVDDEMYAPIQPCTADLSTILEADNSGISKHIPSASPSPSSSPTSPHTFFPSRVTFSPPPPQSTFPISKDRSASQTSCHPSPTTSNLDLSLSKLSAELHDAISPTTADGWSSAVVVEDADAAPPPQGKDHRFDSRDTISCLPQVSDPDATFDFSALDPDLAELLSPHRAPSKDNGESATNKLVPNGLSSVPYGVAGSAIPQTPGPRLHSTPLAERSTTPLSLGCSSIRPPSREPITPLSPSIRPSAVPQPDARSPVSLGSRPSRGAVRSPEPTQLPISRPSLPVRRPPSHLPRLMRSVTSAPPSVAASTPETSVETATRMQRRQPPSPLSAGQVIADTVMRSPSDTTGLRVSSDTCVSRPSVDVSFTPRSSSDTGMRHARAGLVEQNQHPKLQGHISSCSSVNVVPTVGAPPSVPCITTALVPTSTTPSSLSASSSTTLTSSPSATTTSANPRTPTSSPPPTTSTPHDPTLLRRRHHPHLFISRKRSLSVDEPSSLSAHVERPGSSASNRQNGAGRFGLGARNGVRERTGRVNLASGENRLVSSPLTRSTLTPAPGPPTMEWLGPRTVKAFAAAGLFDGEREESGVRFERERAGSVGVNRFEQDREGTISVLSRYDRDREGATSVMSRLDRDRETSLGRYDRDRDYSTINRYASLRDHAPSRAAFSEAASASSFGTRSACTAGNAGPGWSSSPTFSSAARTAFSGSTAPTSVSSGVGSGISPGAGAGVGNAMGTNVRTLQEKHCLETSALLNALADSQDACRRLREENGMLRERLRVLEAMSNQDRDDVGLGRGIGLGILSRDEEDGSDKTHRCDQDFERLSRKHLTSSRISPAHQSRILTPVPRRPHLERSHSHLQQHTRHHTVSAKESINFTFGRTPSPSRSTQFRVPSPQKRQPQPPSSLSVQPPSPQKRQIQRQRRASTSSSLFPAPPPEMSMLMLEDVGLSGTVSESPPSPGGPSPVGKKLGHKHSYSHSMIPRSHSFYAPQSSYANQSVSFTSFASTGTVAPSPSTATFSMTEAPGSPHSLQLRPEHELHLGDMTSLSLYAMSDGEDGDEEEV
ncbi:hypothetical protein EDB19DRAFT_159123 [Suillus lakei]|nr:hypothetical protein EDB19DRAFT_159123 [Suillus lakei]